MPDMERGKALIDKLKSLHARIDCGGKNCGECLQCAKANLGMAIIANDSLRARIAVLEAWQAKANTDLLVLGERLEEARTAVDASRARIALLEETLRFYADDSEFPDGGVRARAALNPPTP